MKIQDIKIDIKELEDLGELCIDEEQIVFISRLNLRLLNAYVEIGKERLEALGITYQFLNTSINKRVIKSNYIYFKIIRYMSRLRETIGSCEDGKKIQYKLLQKELLEFDRIFSN